MKSWDNEENNWIENQKFSNANQIAFRNAELKKILELIKSGVVDNGTPVPVESPNEVEVNEALKELDLVFAVINSTANLRNDLAHGSKRLNPNSIATLRMVRELIDQVFG